MSSNYNKPKKLILLLSCFFILSLSYFAYAKYGGAKMMIAPIEPYNFSDTDIVDIYVNDKWGGEARAGQGAGGGICCTSIPEQWYPGLVANIRWRKTEGKKWFTAVAPIPRYTESADLQVLFMENDTVSVYVMSYWPCSSKHPMPKTEQLCGKRKGNDN